MFPNILIDLEEMLMQMFFIKDAEFSEWAKKRKC